MLVQSWEGYATRLANAESANLIEELMKIAEEESIDLAAPANVIVGRDTRYISPFVCTRSF
jgi:phosphoacetylglucosamine mutase